MSSLTLTYTRRHLGDVVRVPVMLLTVTLVPVSVLLFFFVPFVRGDGALMTEAAANFTVFAVVLACIGHFATVTCAHRESPWGAY